MSGSSPTSATDRTTPETPDLIRLLSRTEDLLSTTDLVTVFVSEQVTSKSYQYRQQVLENPDRFDELVETDEDFPEELELITQCDERLQSICKGIKHNSHQLLVTMTGLLLASSVENVHYQTLLMERKTQIDLIQQLEKTYVSLVWAMNKKLTSNAGSEKVFSSIAQSDGSTVIITNSNEKCTQGALCQAEGCLEHIFSATTHLFLCYDHWVSPPSQPLLLSAEDVKKIKITRTPPIRESENSSNFSDEGKFEPFNVKVSIERSQGLVLKAGRIIDALQEQISEMVLEVAVRDAGLIFVRRVDGPLKQIIENFWELRAMTESKADVRFRDINERLAQLSKLSRGLVDITRRLDVLRECLAGGKNCLVKDNVPPSSTSRIESIDEALDLPLAAMPIIKRLGKHVINTCEKYRQVALSIGMRTLQTIILGQMREKDGNTQLSMNEVIQGCTITFELPNKICMYNGCWKYVGHDSSQREQFCDKHHINGASTNSAELNTCFWSAEEIRSGRQQVNSQRDRAVEYFGKYMVNVKYLLPPGQTVVARGAIKDDNGLTIKTVLGGVTSVRVRGQICLVDECLQKVCSLSGSSPAARCYNHLIYRDTANMLFEELEKLAGNVAAGIHQRVYKLRKEINDIRQRLPPDLMVDTDVKEPFRKSPRKNENVTVESCDELSDGGQKLLQFLSGKRLIFVLLILNYRKEHEQIILEDDTSIRLIAINKALYQLQGNKQAVSRCPGLDIPYYNIPEQKHSEQPDPIYIFLAKYGRLSKLIDITDPNFKIYILVINMLETTLIIGNNKISIPEKDVFTFVEFHSLCENIPEIRETLSGKSDGEERVDLGDALARPVQFIHPQITVRDVLVEYVHLAARAGSSKQAMSIIAVLHDNLATPVLQIVLEMAAVCLSWHSPDCQLPARIITALASRQTQKNASDAETAKRRAGSTTSTSTSTLSSYASDDDTVENDDKTPPEKTESKTLTGLIEEKKTELIAALTRSIFLQGLHEIVDNTEDDQHLQQELHDYISRNARFADMAQTATSTGTKEFAYKNWQTDLSFTTALLDQFPTFLEQRNTNKKRWDTRTFTELYSNLHPEIKDYLRHGLAGNWNYTQQPNKNGESGLNNLDALLVSPSNRSGISQSDLMFEILELSIQEDMGKITTVIALSVYKSMQTHIAYPWSVTDVHFLRKITQYKSADVSQHSCQLFMWYVQKLDEEGDYIFSDVIVGELLERVEQYLSLWPRVPPLACNFENEDQARYVAARCLAARADTSRELGCYKDAMCDLAGALEFNSILHTPDAHFEAECIDSIVDIIKKLSRSEFTQLEKKVFLPYLVGDENDMISTAIALNERARKVTSPENPLYFTRCVKTTALRFDSLQHGTEKEHVTQITRGDAARSLRHFKMPDNSNLKQAKSTLLALVDLYYLVYMCDTTEVSLLELAKDVYHHVHRGAVAILEDEDNATVIPPDMVVRIQETNEILLHFIVPDKSDVVSHIDIPKLVEGNALQLIRTNKEKRNTSCAVTASSRPARQQYNDLTLSVFTDTKKECVRGAWLASGSRYVSTLSSDVGTAHGCCAPIHFSELAPNPADAMDRYSSHHTEQVGLYDVVYEARVWNFKVAENVWHHRKTLICFTTRIPLDMTDCTLGSSRFPVNLHLLSQGYSAGQYVGKFYKNQSSRSSSIIEVVAHEIARQYLSLFMEELEKRCPDNLTKIRMLPVQHVHVYRQDGTILDILNVEPLVTPTGFIKITNNARYVHPDLETDLLQAFLHFTWSRSEGKLMVTDIQGWLPLDKRGFIILTDPLLHTLRHPVLSKLHGNQAQGGFKKFWTAQHQTCSDICRSLELDRDPQYP